MWVETSEGRICWVVFTGNISCIDREGIMELLDEGMDLMKDLVCGFVSASEISPTFNNSFVISICFKVSADRTGTCICTDIAVSACYFCILKYYAPFIEYTASILRV